MELNNMNIEDYNAERMIYRLSEKSQHTIEIINKLLDYGKIVGEGIINCFYNQMINNIDLFINSEDKENIHELNNLLHPDEILVNDIEFTSVIKFCFIDKSDIVIYIFNGSIQDIFNYVNYDYEQIILYKCSNSGKYILDYVCDSIFSINSKTIYYCSNLQLYKSNNHLGTNKSKVNKHIYTENYEYLFIDNNYYPNQRYNQFNIDKLKIPIHCMDITYLMYDIESWFAVESIEKLRISINIYDIITFNELEIDYHVYSILYILVILSIIFSCVLINF